MSDPFTELSRIHIEFLSRDQDALNILSSHLGTKTRTEFSFSYVNKEISDAPDMKEYDVIVSPANSYGEIQGGIDMIYYKSFGRNDLQKHIYTNIRKYYDGEILLGDCMVVDLEKINKLNGDKLLLMCPTMTIPIDVNKTRNAFYFARALIKGLRGIKKHKKIHRVMCPLPCIGVGNMDPKIMALQLQAAFQAIDKKGIITAIYIGGDKNYPEYRINAITQNCKMAYIQLTNGR